MMIVKSLFTDMAGNTPFLRGAGQPRETAANCPPGQGSFWVQVTPGPLTWREGWVEDREVRFGEIES